jgi:predicted RNA-binding protein with RPS1 domain
MNAYEIQDVLVGKVTYIGNSYLIVKVLDYPCILGKEEVEIFPVRSYKPYINKEIVVKVVNIEKNAMGGFDIRVSHRAVAEEALDANKISNFDEIKKNYTYKGIVKDITDYGVFVSLGNIDGLVHISHLPESFNETPENYVQIGSIVDVKVVSKNNEKKQISLSIPSLDQHLKNNPFEQFKKELIPNQTILQGKVVYLERDCVTLHVDYGENKFTVYIKKEDLTWEKTQHAADVVFLGEELKIRYISCESNKLFFDLKWQQQDIYPKELFSMDTEELLSSMQIYENKFIGKINISSDGNNIRAFANNFVPASGVDTNMQLTDRFSGYDINATVPVKYIYGLENGKYYTFVLKAAPVSKRLEKHRPYMFIAQLDCAISVEDPYKRLVEKSFKENKSPKSNREAASYLKEIGADMYTDRDRMFYELLQNADDASSARGVKVMVQIKDDYLIFTHDGLSFSRQDFRSIVSTANSTKRLDRKKTGYKGIGFKSVFTDSEKVYIKTGGFFFVFNKSAELFNDYRSFYKYVNPLYTEDQLKLFFEEYSEYEKEFEKVDHLPWQLLPFWVEEIPEELKGTTFSRNCNVAIALHIGASSDKYKDIIKGIIQKPRFMLFLRNTQRIQFEDKKWDILSIAKHVDKRTNVVLLKNSFASDEKEVSYIVREGSEIPVTNDAFGKSGIAMVKECIESSGREKWHMYQIVDGMRIPITSIPERIIAADTTTLSYAFMLDDKGSVIPIPNRTPALYAYLPMEDRRYLFPFFINADFELSSNRQEAKRVSVWNEYIFYNIGKNIVSWVATLASLAHPHYLSLLPCDFFTEELEESKVDKLAAQFNRGYRESLSETPFILNDREEIVCQSDVCIDESGFADIIGADDFCNLYGSTKRLVNQLINIENLYHADMFKEIEHIQINRIVDQILDKTNIKKLMKYWLSLPYDKRQRLLIHIANMPGNRKNLDCQLCDIPAYISEDRLYSFNQLLKSKNIILRVEEINGIEDILMKLGFKITKDEEQTHAFHKKIENLIAGYIAHLFDIVSLRTRTSINKLTPQEKATLFMHFASNKIGIKHEDLCAWSIYCNQNGVITPLGELTRMDSSRYNRITKKYVIDETEYMLVGKSLDRFLMKEKDQFEKIVIQDWNTLVTEVGKRKDLAMSLYNLISTTYTVAAHEQAEDKNWNPIIERKCIFAHEQMCNLDDVIINLSISKYSDVIHIVETLTEKYVPDFEVIDIVHNSPFNLSDQKLSDLSFLSDVVVDFNQLKILLDFCLKENETIFESFYIEKVEEGYCFKRRSSKQYIAYTNIANLYSYIGAKCKDIILLQNEFADYKGISGILTEEELLLKVLELSDDVKTYSKLLLPVYKNSISPVKTAFIEHISSIDLDETSFIEDTDDNLQILLMASTIEKPEVALFDLLRNKIRIVVNDTSFALASIKLQHTIEFGEHKYPLSKLLPNENKVSMLADNLKERLVEKRLPQIFINNIFGDEIDEERSEEVFSTLNKSNVILDNGVQLAFVLNYIANKKVSTSILCKVYDSSEVPHNRTISNNWYVNGPIFIEDEHILNIKYQELSKYLSLPYQNNYVGCSIKSSIDNYKDVKVNPSTEELFALLDYLLSNYNKGENISSEDIQNIKNCIGFEDKEYVVSSTYCLASEKLPTEVEQWITTLKGNCIGSFLKDVLGLYVDDSDAVAVRKYLSGGCGDLIVSEKNYALSKMTCRWIYNKSLVLNDIQFSEIRDVIFEEDYTCELNKELLSECENAEHLHMVFGEYYLYWYKEEIPWNARLTGYDYVFHSYKEKDIIIDGYNIFFNKNKEGDLYDLVRSIVNTDGFSTDDFLKFIDKYNATISGSLDGEIDKDLDEEARMAASQLAKQEAIEWLRSKGYNTNNVTTNYSFIDGVHKGGITYNIVVKSFRSSSRELKINPNEWLHLLKPNSRLMLYMGHMAFAVIDRKMLLGNHDFLRLRIASSNFSVDGNKLEESLGRLANDIQYFERTHFVFERVNEKILSRANSLDDYGLFKSNSIQCYSAGNEEDIE